MDKVDIIKYMDGSDVVESQLSDALVNQLASLGLEKQNILMYYASSHNGDNHIKLVNLAEKLLEKMANTRIEVMDWEGKPLRQNGDAGEVNGASILFLVQAMLEHPEDIEIRLR